jgi:hypothetical protein
VVVVVVVVVVILKMDEVTGEWRRLHNEELYNLYSSPNIFRVFNSRRMRWAGHVARVRRGEVCIQGFGGETEEKRPLRGPRRRWENDIKMGLEEVDWGGMDWNDLARDRNRWRAVVNAVMNLRTP